MNWTRTYIDDDQRCSFCRRQEPEVGELIPSPSTPRRYICSHCVAVCNGILQDRRNSTPGQTTFPAVTNYGSIITDVHPVEYHYTPDPKPPRRKRRST